jgi:hypothetical protein
MDAFLGKITKKLGYWINVLLSLASRATIINSVLLYTLWSFISIWGGSMQVIRKIRSMLRDFSRPVQHIEVELGCTGATTMHTTKLAD